MNAILQGFILIFCIPSMQLAKQFSAVEPEGRKDRKGETRKRCCTTHDGTRVVFCWRQLQRALLNDLVVDDVPLLEADNGLDYFHLQG